MSTKKYPNPYNDVLNAILQGIKDCGFSKKTADWSSGYIVVSTGASLRSWGEQIEIQVSEAEGSTEVSITSSPQAQLIDWGKSRENIDRLFTAIEKYLKRLRK